MRAVESRTSDAKDGVMAITQGRVNASNIHLKLESTKKLAAAIQPIDTKPEIKTIAVGRGLPRRKPAEARAVVNRTVANKTSPSTPNTREIHGSISRLKGKLAQVSDQGHGMELALCPLQGWCRKGCHRYVLFRDR